MEAAAWFCLLQGQALYGMVVRFSTFREDEEPGAFALPNFAASNTDAPAAEGCGHVAAA